MKPKSTSQQPLSEKNQHKKIQLLKGHALSRYQMLKIVKWKPAEQDETNRFTESNQLTDWLIATKENVFFFSFFFK